MPCPPAVPVLSLSAGQQFCRPGQHPGGQRGGEDDADGGGAQNAAGGQAAAAAAAGCRAAAGDQRERLPDATGSGRGRGSTEGQRFS